ILVDSGAIDNCLHPSVIQQLKIKTQALTHMQRIVNVDGTKNEQGIIHRYTNAKVTLNRHTKTQRFFIMDVGEDCALLGYTFLQTFNPCIDWITKTL
ncbi:hypothetical protein BJV74DRAFT_733148, partial [Russula compacta]